MTSGIYKRTGKHKKIASEGMKRAFKEGRAKLNNLITLCRSCHTSLHNNGGEI